MTLTSRKRARGDNSPKKGPVSRNKTQAWPAGPSTRHGEDGNKIPESLEPTGANSDSQQVPVANNVKCETRPGKIARLELEDSHRDISASAMPEPHILKLPPEIIGEILVLTGSPRHVLAFARTCKHFCYTLIGEGAQFVWRQARHGSQCSLLDFNFIEDFNPVLDVRADFISLPDPPKAFFSEAAYAAFLFDPGPCDNCGKKTFAQYASFALRIRICNSPACRRLPDGLSNPDQFELIVPTNEKSDIIAWLGNGVTYWPFPPSRNYKTLSHETDIAKAREEFLNESGGGNEKRLETLRKRNKEWMHFCSALAKWTTTFNEKYHMVKAFNEKVAHEAAEKFGWEYSDMMNCTVFGSFCKQKSRFLEYVCILDVDRLYDQIESELLALQEKRQRREAEVALMKNREDVEALYNRLRSRDAYDHLPSLPTFRQLPVMQLLQAGTHDGNRGTKIAETLQSNPLMRQQLDQEIKRWIETAKQDLAVVLGFPRQWKSASKKVLHPVERGTAWFLCTKCTSPGNGYQTDGCLDFAGACLHVCQGKNGKNDKFRRSKHAAWNPGNFIKDEKAINVMKSALSKQKMSEETENGLFLRKHTFAVICTSCEPSIVLDSRNMIGHCHRHESMELSFLSRDEIGSHLDGFAYSYGIAAKLIRKGGKTIKRKIDEKDFGCRICLRKKSAEDSTTAVPEAPADPIAGEDQDMNPLVNLLHCDLSQRPKEMPPLFNFNGMRSHLKAKHGIEYIRDEDFFCAGRTEFL